MSPISGQSPPPQALAAAAALGPRAAVLVLAAADLAGRAPHAHHAKVDLAAAAAGIAPIARAQKAAVMAAAAAGIAPIVRALKAAVMAVAAAGIAAAIVARAPPLVMHKWAR